ncbi:hypothetical protein VNI00_014787 [Paramarasmius palmivorus]|uniref:TERF2-interacting telomeric protein 1 Myb domain-containing protein n=1 Tax=Paramarasmius palmivorus TaxID=297713 RepID=A0AAW0BQ96_9AGAR
MSSSSHIPQLPPSRSFSARDDCYLVSFIAKNNPQIVGRKGERLYKRLVEEKGDSHTWSQWRNRYCRHSEEFDRLIQLHLANGTLPTPPLNAPATPQLVPTLSPKKDVQLSPGDRDALIKYLATNTKDMQVRRGQAVYRDLVANVGGYSPWGVRRNMSSWRNYYLDNAAEIEEQISTRFSVSVEPVQALTCDRVSLIPNPTPNPARNLSSRRLSDSDEALARYLAQQKLLNPELGYGSLRVYEGFVLEGGAIAQRRHPTSWKARYYEHRTVIEELISKYMLEMNRVTPSAPHLESKSESEDDELVYPPGQELDPELGSDTESTATPVTEYHFTAADLYFLRELEELPRPGFVFKVNEDLLFLKYIATNSNDDSVFVKFVKDIAGADSHASDAWCQRYTSNRVVFDRLVREYQKRTKTDITHIPTPASMDRRHHTFIRRVHSVSPTAKRKRSESKNDNLMLPSTHSPKKSKSMSKGDITKAETSPVRLIVRIPALKDRIRLSEASKRAD